MKSLPSSSQLSNQTSLTGDPELDRGLLLLAEEIARTGKAGDPETPAFIRRMLGKPIEIEERPLPNVTAQKRTTPRNKPFLRVKGCWDGARRYELVFPPPNNFALIAIGRFEQRMRMLWRRITNPVEIIPLPENAPIAGAVTPRMLGGINQSRSRI